MIFDLPFDIVYSPDYESEIIVDGWEKKTVANYTYYETVRFGVNFQILIRGKYWYFKSSNRGSECVTGFFGIRFPWKNGYGHYTMVPSVYYDGNYDPDRRMNFPVLHLPEYPVFQASFSASGFPSVFVKEGSKGYFYEVSHKSYAGWNGFELDAENETLTVYAPAKEKSLYGHSPAHKSRAPYVMYPGDVISVRIARTEFDCNSITDLFESYWDKAHKSEFYSAYNSPKVSETDGVKKVFDFIYRKHCVVTPEGEPLILNAFTDPFKDWPHGGWAEWNTMIGWCSGSMTALPMLKYGGKYRDFVIKYLDFLSTHGFSPSGVKYSIYDGNSWMNKDHKEYNEEYDHCRFYCDYIYYLGKAISLEKENCSFHQSWEEDFERGINILVDLWGREHDFGVYWSLEKYPVEITKYGSGSGAFALLALAEGVRHFPDRIDIKNAFNEACDEYYSRCVLTGRSLGGPKDIRQSDDSESIAAIADALTQRYQLFSVDSDLEKALNAAKMFSTWVINYVPEFPGGSMFEGYNLCGGVIANVRNRHIGPGICTNSARFLYDLGQLTGDNRWEDLYFRIKSAAINCITAYDGEFFGKFFNEIFVEGMLSEQINITDALNHPGETWRVSACWPSTAVLLGWFDSPKIDFC